VVPAREAGLDGVVPKVAKRCCYQVRTCATLMEALVIASVASVAVFAGRVLPPLKQTHGHRPVLRSVIVLLCRAKIVLGVSWCGVAVEVDLLSAVAKHGAAGCHAANTSHAICVGFLRGPLNSRVGSAIEHAIVVFADWVAWRRVCNAKGLTQAQVESQVTLVVLGLDNEGSCGHVERDSAL
jgi:hypothetical protein